MQDFHPAFIAVFVLGASALYFRPLFAHYPTKYAFLTLLLVSLFGMHIVAASYLFPLVIIFFSLIFYIILGIKDYLFVRRGRFGYVVMLFLHYALFTIFFLWDKSEFFWAQYIISIVIAFVLLREWLVLATSFNFPKRETLAAAIGALIVAQLLWAVALLPIGFISSANIMLLAVFIISDLLFKHFMGAVSKKVFVQEIVFFILIAVLIITTSTWSLPIR